MLSSNIIRQLLPKFCIALLAVATLGQSASAEVKTHNKLVPKIDTAYLPITSAELQTDLKANSDNDVVLVQLLRRGYQQNEIIQAYNTMLQMKNEQPQNPAVLAAYCFSVDVAVGKYNNDPNFPVQRLVGKDRDAAEAGYWTYLRKAIQLDPKTWLAYLLEGENMVYHSPTELQGLSLLKKAVELAPNSAFAHDWLGEAYSLYTPQLLSYPLAIHEFKEAMTLTPVDADAAIQLFTVYHYFVKNREKAIAAKHELLASLPNGAYLTPTLKQDMALD